MTLCYKFHGMFLYFSTRLLNLLLIFPSITFIILLHRAFSNVSAIALLGLPVPWGQEAFVHLSGLWQAEGAAWLFF